MEGVAWVLHKYVMHGFLWVLHKSHHEPRKGVWELNDAFGLFFARDFDRIIRVERPTRRPALGAFRRASASRPMASFTSSPTMSSFITASTSASIPRRDICDASIRRTGCIMRSMERTDAFLSGSSSPVRRSTSSGNFRSLRRYGSSSTARSTQSARCIKAAKGSLQDNQAEPACRTRQHIDAGE